jgi:DNA-directed RNA polymerase subunit RPC12/RpoP
MKEIVCLCLGCGGQFSAALKDDSELAAKRCPNCGGSNLVKYNPSNFFRSLFGGFSGGG